MNPMPADLDIVLYALGALDAADREAIDRRRRRDAALDQEIETWERRVAPLALSAPEAAPPPGLWDKISAAMDKPDGSASDLRVIRFDHRGWEPWAPGLEVKILTRDGRGEPESFLMRMQPGTIVPEHHHDRIEECLIIEGDLVHEGHVLGPGDFTVAHAGGTHSQMQTRTGGLLYIRYLAA
ncbi:MAG: cupin domain-containing protein [Rhodoplanes sp.]|uniref:cupin domain-containing protein n=1 Tax=Rhodoplanes sp. TaxID=1968906 RepID=UPI001858A7B7|nr:cupin domain-containing protein [Rhodoplanes sp.]NVO16520.1 cupin domain-containing protein [Rhodoplanes sp.]